MRVDRRYRMYGIPNANYCMSMMRDEFEMISKLLLDYFKAPLRCSTVLAMRHDPCHAAPWYYEFEDSVVTVYFPNEEDLNRVDEFKTFARLAND